MKYGYARVSTNTQDLQSQINQLEAENCDQIFSEKISGRTNNRPQFYQLIDKLEINDTLVITKLDRFARSTKEALAIIEKLFHKGIRIHILNIGIIENTPTGRLIFTVFSAFADFERDLIVERTQEGKAIAKQHPSFKEGRPKKFKTKQLDHALQLKKTHSYKQVEELTGISKSTLWRFQNKQKRIGT